MSSIWYPFGLALAFVSGPLAGQRNPSLHQWMSLAGADNPSISPDGRSVAYTLVTPDWNRDGLQRQIWVVSSDGSGRRQVTPDSASSRDARWSPDGKRLAFLSSRGAGVQVYLMTMPDGPTIQLTKADQGVTDFRWAPDGSRIAYLSGASVGQATPEPKEFHVVGNDSRWSAAIWLVDVPALPTGPVVGERLTDPTSFVADDIAWSPDSRRIALHASAVGAKYEFWTYDIYVVDVASRQATRIVDTPGPDFFPIWSPDSKEIAYRTYVTGPGQEYGPHSMGYLAVVPAAGGRPRILSNGFDEQATAVAWTTDGIYFTGRIRSYQHLFLLNPTTKAFRRVTDPLESLAVRFSFTPDGRQVAFVGADSSRFQEIYVSPLGAELRPIRLTNTGAQLDGWSLSSREMIGWTAPDGLRIEGVLFKPPGFDPKRRYPLVVIVHGGPQAADDATISRDLPYVAEIYAQQGFLVLRPNFRGSIGYGKRFREAIVNSTGIPEYHDVVSGVDYLVRRGWADSARVGLMGWSYGGYLAALAATFGHRFAAISVGAGVSDGRLFYTLGTGSTNKPTAATPTPWDRPELYRLGAPLTYVKRARTPTLIQHGELDDTAPIASAQELYRALQDQGVETKMIIYRGAGHVPNGWKQFEAMATHNIEWFAEHLAGPNRSARAASSGKR